MAFDLQPTDEQKALKETLRAFAGDVLRPRARDAEAAGRTPVETLAQIHDIGVAAPVAEEFGGAGTFDAVTYCIAAEELAWGDPGIAYDALASGIAAVVVGRAGSEEQKKRLLPSLAGAEPVRSFVAMGEKVAAGDLESLDTTVDSDKATGIKYFVVAPTEAALGVVVGRAGDDLGAVVFEGGSGYEVVKPEDKLGLQAVPTAVVSFDGEGSALPAGTELDQAILWAKLLTGAIAVGCARAALEYASEYAVEREAFGKPIGAFQGISFKVAEMAIEVDAARLSVWRAAWKIGRSEATLADVAEANAQALSAAIRCGDDAVQILGGHGYMRDHPVEKWFRDAVTLSVFDAPDLLGDVMVARSAGLEGGS